MNKGMEQENEIKVSREFAERIKKRWDELAERQKSGKFAARSDRKITEVSFIRDCCLWLHEARTTHRWDYRRCEGR